MWKEVHCFLRIIATERKENKCCKVDIHSKLMTIPFKHLKFFFLNKASPRNPEKRLCVSQRKEKLTFSKHIYCNTVMIKKQNKYIIYDF